MSEQPPKRAKILTRLRINEVSLVDRGAGQDCRVVISKRDDANDDNRPVEMPEHERRYWAALGATALRHAEERYAKEHGTGAASHEPADDEPENPFTKIFSGMRVSESAGRAMAKVAAELNKGNDADDDNEGLKRDGREAIADIVEDVLDQDDDGKPAGNDHHASKVADLLVESGKHPHRQAALDHLLHTASGQALLRRMHKQHEDPPTMTSEQKLRSIAKNHGVAVIAKIMVADNRSYGISEHELVDLISNHERRDGESAAQCFVRHYEAATDDGLALRKAVTIAKSAPLLQDDSEAEADAAAACKELQAIGKARWGSLSPSQQFARAFETNPELARRAHRRPSVFSTSYPFPRS